MRTALQPASKALLRRVAMAGRHGPRGHGEHPAASRIPIPEHGSVDLSGGSSTIPTASARIVQQNTEGCAALTSRFSRNQDMRLYATKRGEWPRSLAVW